MRRAVGKRRPVIKREQLAVLTPLQAALKSLLLIPLFEQLLFYLRKKMFSLFCHLRILTQALDCGVGGDFVHQG